MDLRRWGNKLSAAVPEGAKVAQYVDASGGYPYPFEGYPPGRLGGASTDGENTS